MKQLSTGTQASLQKSSISISFYRAEKQLLYTVQILPERYAYSEISGTSILI